MHACCSLDPPPPPILLCVNLGHSSLPPAPSHVFKFKTPAICNEFRAKNLSCVILLDSNLPYCEILGFIFTLAPPYLNIFFNDSLLDRTEFIFLLCCVLIKFIWLHSLYLPKSNLSDLWGKSK
jgi:hypothetical protein